MSLSKNAIQEFQRIYRDQYDDEISEADARECGERLVLLVAAVVRDDDPTAEALPTHRAGHQGIHYPSGCA